MGQQWDQERNQKVSGNKLSWTHNPILLRHSKGSPEQEVQSITGLPKEDRKFSKDLTLHLQELEEQQTKPRVSRRNKIRVELNDMETKRTIQRSINPGAGSLKR